MFNVEIDNIPVIGSDYAKLSVMNDAQFGNHAVLFTHSEDEDAFEESTVVLMFNRDNLRKFASAVKRAEEALDAAEQGGIVGLAKWTEANGS
ncbi:hypothetical protein CW362_28840 [Streptomyces populi]|uniref:Uncharacterized protein n=1 Tax=Streptomyces populi TaxID=2058924 RepID=A0A2I0SHZ0_9ACTN|nr:hypothetical protein [Streptomyces populi]PKT69553.1 hypothetical protein CW362_28840 [Streptomyces populi]